MGLVFARAQQQATTQLSQLLAGIRHHLTQPWGSESRSNIERVAGHQQFTGASNTGTGCVSSTIGLIVAIGRDRVTGRLCTKGHTEHDDRGQNH